MSWDSVTVYVPGLWDGSVPEDEQPPHVRLEGAAGEPLDLWIGDLRYAEAVRPGARGRIWVSDTALDAIADRPDRDWLMARLKVLMRAFRP